MKKKQSTFEFEAAPYVPRTKMTKLNAHERALAIEQALGLVWDSMHSHLAQTYAKGAAHEFEKRCVQEYASLMQIISHLY